MSYRKDQQGVAIVLALFILAIVTTLAYTMMSRLDRDTQRTALLLRDTQATFYAQGSVAWARDDLRNNWEHKKIDQVVDPIPIKSPENEINGYKVVSVITDMQSRFNINNLDKPESQEGLKRLIKSVQPALGMDQIALIVQSVKDWLTPNNSQNAQSRYYLELPVPYRPAHRPMQSASEISLVKGMTPAIYNALQPYLAALPSGTPLNVQTASMPVLMSLSPTLTRDVALTIDQLRKQKPILSAEAFQNLDIIKNHHLKLDGLAVISNYFLVETTVTMEKQRLVLYTLLERVTKDKKALVNIVWQSIGVW